MEFEQLVNIAVEQYESTGAIWINSQPLPVEQDNFLRGFLYGFGLGQECTNTKDAEHQRSS